MKRLLTLFALLVLPALGQRLPVVNGNAVNGSPGDVQVVMPGNWLGWVPLSVLTNAIGGMVQTNISLIAVTNRNWVTNFNGATTNLNVYFSGAADPLTINQPTDVGANIMFKNGATNYATVFTAPPLGVGLGNHDISQYILLEPITGAFSWTGIATGNGNLITGDDETYGSGWNNDTTLPTKNAVYDKIETIVGGGIPTLNGTGTNTYLKNVTIGGLGLAATNGAGGTTITASSQDGTLTVTGFLKGDEVKLPDDDASAHAFFQAHSVMLSNLTFIFPDRAPSGTQGLLVTNNNNGTLSLGYGSVGGGTDGAITNNDTRTIIMGGPWTFQSLLYASGLNETESPAWMITKQADNEVRYTRNGSILTNLNAGNIASGTINSARLPLLTNTFGITIDGGGSAITTGIKGYISVPYACNIESVTMLADQSGSAVVDVWKDSYANFPPTVADTITASAKPTIAGATKSQDTTLTGWTKTLANNDTIAFNVDSAATITRLTLTLKVTHVP